VAVQWDSLLPATKEVLAPFLAPPAYQGSWAQPHVASLARQQPNASLDCTARDAPPALDGNWAFIETPHTKIWYRTVDVPDATAFESELAAQEVATVIEPIRTDITTLFGTEAPGDSLETCNGGDDRLDIYVMPVVGLLGVTVPFPPGGTLTPSFMVVDAATTAESPEKARAIIAHEYLHTLHMGVYDYHEDYLSYRWLEEASANWVIDYIYPDDNFEHAYADSYIGDKYQPAESIESSDTENGYQDYVFLQYLARKFGNKTIADIWSGVQTKSSIDAIDTAIPGGWKERWPDFALWAWNRSPVRFFQELDGLDARLPITGLGWPLGAPYGKANGRLDVSLQGKGAREFELAKPSGTSQPWVRPRSMRYAYFTFPDDAVRSVELQHFSFREIFGPVANPNDDPEFGKVQAWIKLADGTVTVEDWTMKEEVEFCREDPAENVVELMLLYTFSKPIGAFDGHLSIGQGDGDDDKLIASTDFCEGVIQGTASGTYTQPSGLVHTWDATYVLEQAVSEPGFLQYRLRSGSVNWRVEGYWPTPDCRVTPMERTFQLEPPWEVTLDFRDWDENGAFDGYLHEFPGSREVEGTVTCPDGDPIPLLLPALFGGSAEEDWDGTFPLTGSTTYSHGEGDTVSWQWSLDRHHDP